MFHRTFRQRQSRSLSGEHQVTLHTRKKPPSGTGIPAPAALPAERAALARARLPALKRLLARCRLCPRECDALRLRGETGECGLTAELLVSSSHLHHGEEPVLSGRRGSGTVFFAGCNLACLFCQNYDISQLRLGRPESPGELAARFLALQRAGAHNINLVTPTPQVTRIVEALALAWERGLDLPIVYNCGGYEGLEALRHLDGLVDIYLTDLKYGGDGAGGLSTGGLGSGGLGNDRLSDGGLSSGRLSGVEDYFTRAKSALREMHRQVGVLEVDREGIARRGVIVRHLVLPGGLAGSEEALRFLAREIDRDTYLSLMSQYHPAHRAHTRPPLDRRLARREYQRVLETLDALGLHNGYFQPPPWS